MVSLIRYKSEVLNLRVTTNGGGGAGAGGHIDVAVGDPALAPFTINPEDHTDTWPVNFWHWTYGITTAPGTLGHVELLTAPPGGVTWQLCSPDGYMGLNTMKNDVRLTMYPTTDFATFDEIAAQWQTFGVGSQTLVAGYLNAKMEIGWGTFPNTYGFDDAFYFEKRGGDPAGKIYAVISDATGDHVAVDTGETLLPGDVHKFAIRVVKDGLAWVAYFYIDDAMVYTNNSTVLTWWPLSAALHVWQVCYTKLADGFATFLLVKPPWIYMAR